MLLQFALPLTQQCPLSPLSSRYSLTPSAHPGVDCEPRPLLSRPQCGFGGMQQRRQEQQRQLSPFVLSPPKKQLTQPQIEMH